MVLQSTSFQLPRSKNLFSRVRAFPQAKLFGVPLLIMDLPSLAVTQALAKMGHALQELDFHSRHFIYPALRSKAP